MEAACCGHTYTRSLLFWNNARVNVNFKWIPCWFSLSQSKQVKKETISIWERRMFAPRGCFPSNLEPFQAISIPGATVPSDRCYFSFVLLHNSFLSLLPFFFFFFQMRHLRLIRGGLFWESVFVAKANLASQVVSCTFTQLIIYKLLVICCFLCLYFKSRVELRHEIFLFLKTGEKSERKLNSF